MSKKIITFGTFDVFHVGHLRLLERARAYGDALVVGVSTDRLNFSKKGRSPVYDQQERVEIIRALRCVDSTFLEDSLELKREYILEQAADVLIMGNDWEGKFDDLGDICEVVYFPRTPSVSTTEIIEKIRD